MHRLVRAALDNRGREIFNPIPVEIPLDMKRPKTMDERIAEVIASELGKIADAKGMESWDEANDFGEEDDEWFPDSKYEMKEENDERLRSYDSRRAEETETTVSTQSDRSESEEDDKGRHRSSTDRVDDGQSNNTSGSSD